MVFFGGGSSGKPEALGPVDIVYTWGVLHHTGDVWQAIHNAQLPLAEDGLLLVAVYADEFYDEKDNIIKMKDFYRKASIKQQEHLDIGVGTWSVSTILSGFPIHQNGMLAAIQTRLNVPHSRFHSSSLKS